MKQIKQNFFGRLESDFKNCQKEDIYRFANFQSIR